MCLTVTDASRKTTQHALTVKMGTLFWKPLGIVFHRTSKLTTIFTQLLVRESKLLRSALLDVKFAQTLTPVRSVEMGT
jgi:hypothetical protein